MAPLLIGPPTAGCGGPGNRYVQDAPREELDPVELRRELVEMAELGQRVRRKLARAIAEADAQDGDAGVDADLVDRVEHVEYRHAERMRRIFELLGNRWPGTDLVGEKASRAALIVVQHLDDYRGLQKRALRLVKRAVKDGKAPKSFVAYLKDRLRISTERDQLYGTQIQIVDGEIVPWPIQNPDGLERRRKAMGLPPMEDYLDQMRKHYGLAPADEDD